jgi:MFS family permease
MYALYCLNEILVFYQRACPSVLYRDIAKSYHVDVSHLSLFSSMYFYAYGILQPFTGLIADVFEPAYLIGGSTFFSSVGAMVCGLSRTFPVGCAGRLLVGIATAPIFVPGCRFAANWFPLRLFPRFTGGLIGIGGVGGILGQAPTVQLARALGWRW